MSFERLESFIFEKMGETNLPGVSAAIIRDGAIIWARGFGYRDIAGGLPATPHTLYGIGSITKSFTVIALLQLAEAGKLSLDDPVEQHIPAFKLRPGGEVVKLHHLLSHTSGIPALAYAEAMIGNHTGDTPYWLPIGNPQDMLTFLADADDWLYSKPGESYNYFNEGFALAGYIVELISGEPYTEYVRTHILEPLGMQRSFFDRASVDADPEAATPYLQTDDGPEPSSYAYGSLIADGGLISSVQDMARYVSMFLGDGAFEGARILSPESMAEMQRTRTATPWQDTDFGEPGYALGLGTATDFFGHRLVQHGGSVGVATAHMAFLPEEQLGIIILANTSGYSMQSLAHYGLAIALGEDPEQLSFVPYERRMKAIEGIYETYKGTMRFEVRSGGGLIGLTERGRHASYTQRLVPEELTDEVCTFRMVNGQSWLPVTFTLKDGGVELHYERYLFRKVGRLP